MLYFDCNLGCDVPPDLLQDNVQYEYNSYENKTLFSLFIDYEFGSNNEEKINSLLEKYYERVKDKVNYDEIEACVINKLYKL